MILVQPPRTDTGKQLASWLPKYGLDEVFSMVDAANNRRRELALQTYSNAREKLKVPIASDQVKSGFGVEFLERTGDVQLSIAKHGKLADLVVTPLLSDSASTGHVMMLEAALRETGRPVLLVPGKVSQQLPPEHIAIAWNGSSEAARALAMTMPFLRKAKRVTSISIRENNETASDQQELADYLRCHDKESSAVSLEGSPQQAGSLLLSESARLSADLLIMGAYTHNRARRLFFGGATSHILQAAEIPVAMVHQSEHLQSG